MSTRRSNTLVHWTGGKDIDPDYEDSRKPEYYQKFDVRSERYLERLKGTLEGGLWMKRKLVEFYLDSGKTFSQAWPYTCFTGMRLSESRDHIRSYGRLGFGFSRTFIMKWSGGPVLYLPGKKELDTCIGANSQRSNHFKRIFDILGFLRDETVKTSSYSGTSASYKPKKNSPAYPGFHEFIKASRFQEFLDAADWPDKYKFGDLMLFPKLLASMVTIAIFVKEMSDEESSAFELYDEEEWRLCYVNECNKFIETDEDDLLETDEDDAPYKLKKFIFESCDLSTLYVPEEIKDDVLEDEDILTWFDTDRQSLEAVLVPMKITSV